MSAGDFTPALAALDRLIAVELQRLRARYALSLDEFRGLYVSDALVDALLARQGAAIPETAPRLSASLVAPVAEAGRALGLCPLGCGLVMLALAPELDARYPTLFAYLNDDVTRRWPSLELAQRLFAGPGNAAASGRLRAILSPALPTAAGGLTAGGLLLPAEPDEPARPLLLRGWRCAPALVHHLLRQPGLPLSQLAWLPGPPDGLAQRPAGTVETAAPALLVAGPPGSGRRAAAAAWAGRLGLRALLYDPTPASGVPAPEALREAALSAQLNRAALVIDLGRSERPAPLDGLDPRWPVALLVQRPDGWTAALAPRLVQQRRQRLPDTPARAALWRGALAACGRKAAPRAIEAVAGRFALGEPAIVRAARRLGLEDEAPRADLPALVAAARAESTAELSGTARPVATDAGWSDLVLPAGALAQLKDFASAVALRGKVFDLWGFDGVGRGTGRGLAALFSGGSGTGKTMSAAIVAAEVGLDLWRLDLSATVSKYIGETEKNLERVFSAAGAANAILFFDEADALFGKRSEVKDSHDRYANIEIAYLLQRLEDHDGVVILATNLSRNLDTAFLRRLPFVIEFPLPDAAARAKLWRKAIPVRAPLCPEVDFAELAQRFELSGGDIRTAALEAAFLAAGRGGRIDREALDTAIRRQLMKRGQLPGAPARRGTNGHAATPAVGGGSRTEAHDGPA
ncbi:ATPase family associated with various cellular activities (AAA) [Tistlia consotensis]|uniref:ATPase family associated with various cellular activities (AAA) n=1 Tax=Tistlia consotensis USBA 355 TaxID=560819 RepID=A0A1Y6BEE4_9PROT|nr:ATP-binding protein [Tistlia consotensis]SMF03120.1 ATPase family associated with various cellular activities (AAA) [Tistlia consotensis USBA 355]SNR53461.1 ATPase family associated with various cellular activities (AAA) [Tistlia consotensis]